MPLFIPHLHGLRHHFRDSTKPMRRPHDSSAGLSIVQPAEQFVALHRRTFKQVIGDKFLDHVADQPMRRLAVQAAEIAGISLVAAALISPHVAGSAALVVLAAGGYALPKVCVAAVAVLYRRELWRAARASYEHVRYGEIAVEEIEPDEVTLEGVPVIELVDFLIRNRNFIREGENGARATFGLRMERYQRLAGNLERVGILVRGENNSRIIAPEWTRQTLIDFLAGAVDDDSDSLSSKLTISNTQKVRKTTDELKNIDDEDNLNENV